LAIIPGAGVPAVAALGGAGQSKELIFTGRRVDATEALQIGLVNQVSKPEALLDDALGMAG